MRTIILSLILIMICPWLQAGEIIGEYRWSELEEEGKLRSGTIEKETRDGRIREVLVIENSEDKKRTFPIFSIDYLPLSQPAYALIGDVSGENIQGDGYLEMWNVFSGRGRFFSRTLADKGPAKTITGSFKRRRFVIPFSGRRDSPHPDRLTLNVVLLGKGEVRLGPVSLEQFAPGEDPLAHPGQWWPDETGGWVGASLGVVLGILGALVGILAGKGKSRKTVMGLLTAILLLGTGALIAAAAALIDRQPFPVYYPLILPGFIAALLAALIIRPVRKRYQKLELKRIRALDEKS